MIDSHFKTLDSFFPTLSEKNKCIYLLKKCISNPHDLYHENDIFALKSENENISHDIFYNTVLYIVNNIKINIIIPEINFKVKEIQNDFYLYIFDKFLKSFKITSDGDDFYSGDLIGLDTIPDKFDHFEFKFRSIIFNIVWNDIIPTKIDEKEKSYLFLVDILADYLSKNNESIINSFKYISWYISQNYKPQASPDLKTFFSQKVICMNLINEIDKILSVDKSISTEILFYLSLFPVIYGFLKQLKILIKHDNF